MDGNVTLNEIAQLIAHRVGKPFDHMFIETLKFSIKYWRAKLIRQDLERNNDSPEFYRRVTLKLQKTDIADTCVVDLDCDVLRTQIIVPKPVRQKTDEPFAFVGSPDGKQRYTFTAFEELPYTLHNKYTKDLIRYNWNNGYIYIFNNKLLKYVTLRYIPADPNSVKDDCSDAECYTDDSVFPIGDDMLETIVTGIINKELRLLPPPVSEVMVDEQEDTTTNRKRR